MPLDLGEQALAALRDRIGPTWYQSFRRSTSAIDRERRARLGLGCASISTIRLSIALWTALSAKPLSAAASAGV
jgi:hypothetical protein